jgi:hypothetical protein
MAIRPAHSAEGCAKAASSSKVTRSAKEAREMSDETKRREDAALDAAAPQLRKLCGCPHPFCEGSRQHRDGFRLGYRMRVNEELREQAELIAMRAGGAEFSDAEGDEV